MKLRNNTNALFVAIDSRTRMKQSAIKIACTLEGTVGHAQHYYSRAMIVLSTRAPIGPEKLISVVTAEKNSSAVAALGDHGWRLSRIGKNG